MKSIGDESKCPECKNNSMHEVCRDNIIIRFCTDCDYEFKFKKRRMNN